MKTLNEMAHEAGLHLATDVNWMPIIGLKYAEKFAELVRADEREACAQVCEEDWSNEAEKMYGEDCAAAIRARGTQDEKAQ